jgi:hypothetical protein
MTLLPLLFACTPAPADRAEAPTWHADVAPIVQERCSGCHQEGGAAFDLLDADAAVAMSNAMSSAVAERRMPPWGAFETEACVTTRDWVGDRRLSDEEIATIVDWADAGAPVGEPAADLASATTPGLTEDLLDLQPVGSFVSSARADEFACVVVDPGNTADLWVDGIEVLPSNSAIAHHALVYTDPARSAEALANDAGWYECAGGMGLTDSTFLSTWVPGSGPTVAPEGTGLRIPANSLIVLQMHYHPSGTAGLEDRTTLRLQQMADTPSAELHNTLLGNAYDEASGLLPGPNDDGAAEFRIPANVAGHTEEMFTTIEGSFPNLPIANVGAHMHLIGTQMELWIERSDPDAGEPDTECLLPVSRYDYDWQQLYRYDAPLAEMPAISGGDSIRMRCTYDNTLDNPGTRRALEDAGEDAPVDIHLGEGTLDEMCIAMVGVVY